MKKTGTYQNLQWAFAETDINARHVAIIIAASLAIWLILMFIDGWPGQTQPETPIPLDQAVGLSDVA